MPILGGRGPSSLLKCKSILGCGQYTVLKCDRFANTSGTGPVRGAAVRREQAQVAGRAHLWWDWASQAEVVRDVELEQVLAQGKQGCFDRALQPVSGQQQALHVAAGCALDPVPVTERASHEPVAFEEIAVAATC